MVGVVASGMAVVDLVVVDLGFVDLAVVDLAVVDFAVVDFVVGVWGGGLFVVVGFLTLVTFFADVAFTNVSVSWGVGVAAWVVMADEVVVARTNELTETAARARSRRLTTKPDSCGFGSWVLNIQARSRQIGLLHKLPEPFG